MTTEHIGTSGWSYDHWEHVLYPPGLAARDRLGRYVQAFDTVELNASFYRWPRTATFASWRRRLPEGFQLTVKAPRGLTHAKRLYAPEVWVDRICAAWHELYDRRGVLLVQLHPRHERDDARLAYFLSRFPWWVRIAVEFRHPSWVDDRVFSILSDHDAAYCVMSGAGCPACSGPPRPGCTSGCTDPIMIISTVARTAMTILVGGQRGSGSGRRPEKRSMPTSTMTAAATPSATRRPCGT